MIVGSPTKLNLIPSGVMPVVYINQGDAGYDKEFLVYNGDSPYNVPAGVSATIRGKKADGYGVTEAAALTEGSNLVTVTITEQMVAAAGENVYELVFVDTDGLRIATINMVWAVKADALGDAVISESDLDYATYVMNELQSVAVVNVLAKQTQAALEAEVAARSAADTTLQNNINAEATARAAADTTLQNNITSEATTRAAQDASLQTQINQIVAPTGTAPSAAEVQDARIGADGVTYTSLGLAIRTNDQETRNDLIDNNVSNLLEYIAKTNNSSVGVNYTWSGNECIVAGTSTGTSYNTIFNNQNGFPKGVLPGGSYIGLIEGSTGKTNIAVYSWKNGALTQLAVTPTPVAFTIPEDATGLIIRVLVWGNVTVNETVKPKFLTGITGKMMSEKISALEPIAVKAILNEGTVAATGYTDANDITTSGICFCSSIGGAPDINNVPFFPCWIQTIGSDATHSYFMFQVAYPYDPTKTMKYRVKQGTWSEWSGLGATTTTIQQSVSQDTYNNEYNITTSPTITTDANGWLQPVDTNTASETGKTDMTGAIMSMLTETGYCHLAPGIYYVSGSINMPAGSMLEGCGKDTIIRLLQSTTSGYIVRMHTQSTLKNVCLSGGYAQGSIADGNIGGRIGVSYIGNRDGSDPSITPSTCTCCMIEGCWFENLDSGIYGYNAGGGLQEGLICNNCYITRCKAGINLAYWTEYCKFTNIITFQCYYACINNGGNNVFTACTFHGVIGFLIDNSSGTLQNAAHGTVNGCTFNHIDNMNHPETLGNGCGIKVINVLAGFVFANCQLWYGRVHVENSKGIQFSGCELGGSNPIIETSGVYMVFFNDCLFSKTPTLDVNSPATFNDCYTYDSIEVTN